MHACHGAARQIDVLREVLVGLLEDDPTLEPRDIVVMCPDIETYAPLISAGFGLGELIADDDADDGLHPAHRLQVRLADRAASSTNPLLSVAVALVELAGGRATASQVIDLLSRAVCRRAVRLRRRRPRQDHPVGRRGGCAVGIDGTQRAAYAMGLRA